MRRAIAKALKRRLREAKKVEAVVASVGAETPIAGGPDGDESPVAGKPDEDEEPVPEASDAPLAGEPGPEPIPEAPEAALWPEAGVQVAVGVEHLQHSLRLGEKGTCEGLIGDSASLRACVCV